MMTDYLSKKIRIVSFLAILFVVLQHAINFTGYIDPNSSFIGRANANTIIQYVVGYGFARIAVALFFMLSGYLFFRNFALSRYFSKLRSRVRSLLVPYILWSALGLVFVWLLQKLPGLSDYFSGLYTGRVIGQPFPYYLQSILNHGVSFQLWFLADLMLYTLLAPLFYIVITYASLLFILPLYVLWLMQIPLPPLLAFVYRGGLFYLLGAYIALNHVYLPKEKTKHLALLALLCWMTILVIKTSVAFGVLPSQWLTLQQLDNMALLMGIAAVWFGYDVISRSRLFYGVSLLTPFTFFIYGSHEPLLEVVKRIGVDLIGRTDGSLLVLYGCSIAVAVSATLAIGFVLRRYMPKLFGLLTGGR